MRGFVPLLLAAASSIPVGCGDFVFQNVSMPTWAEVEAIRDSDAQSYRVIALDMRADAKDRHATDEVVQVESPPIMPAALVVHVWRDEGPDSGVPVLVVQGASKCDILPAEYSLKTSVFGPSSNPSPATPQHWDGVAKTASHCFRYMVWIPEPGPVELGVRMLARDKVQR